MKPLHELTADYLPILNMIEDAEGDVTEALSAALDAVAEPWEQKVEHRVYVLQRLDGQIGIIKAEVKRLEQRCRGLERHADWLRTDTLTQMLAVGVRRLKTAFFTITVRLSPPSVNVLDEKLVPDCWTHTDTIFNKRDILKHFTDTGEVVPGVEIVTDRESLVIR